MHYIIISPCYYSFNLSMHGLNRLIKSDGEAIHARNEFSMHGNDAYGYPNMDEG